jgi:AcrR family transcriptional regulator
MQSITRHSRPEGNRTSAEERILAATGRLLAEGTSFTGLGMQRIAAEAGIARSTLYSYFPDKARLLMRLGTQLQDTAFAAVGSWGPSEPGGGLDGLIRLFRDEIFPLYRRYGPVLKALDEVAAYDSAVAKYWGARNSRFVENNVRMIREEQEAGRTPVSVDPVLASKLCILGGYRFIVDHVATDNRSEDASAARELACTWWYGMFRRPDCARRS